MNRAWVERIFVAPASRRCYTAFDTGETPAPRPARSARSKAVVIAIVIVAAITSGCTKFDALNATVPPFGYRRTNDIAFGSLPRQKLDVYVPCSTPARSDVVIFFYGGEWHGGEKGDYRFVAQALTSRGFIAVLPDYRLNPPATFPSFVEDGALALRWVHDHIQEFGGDPRHIYLLGHSAGAHLAMLLSLDQHYLKDVGLDRRAIRATAGVSGPYDFFPYREDWAVFNMTGASPLADPRIEPINFVSADSPPILLIQGLKDQTVQPGNAQRLAAKLRDVGGCVQLIEYPDTAHVETVMGFAWSFRWLDPVLDDTTRFFHRER